MITFLSLFQVLVVSTTIWTGNTSQLQSSVVLDSSCAVSYFVCFWDKLFSHFRPRVNLSRKRLSFSPIRINVSSQAQPLKRRDILGDDTWSEMGKPWAKGEDSYSLLSHFP